MGDDVNLSGGFESGSWFFSCSFGGSDCNSWGCVVDVEFWSSGKHLYESLFVSMRNCNSETQ